MQINSEIIKRIPDIGCEAFSLLCYMVSVSDGNLQTTVDYETMRRAIRASKSTVKAALEKLRAASLVTWVGRFASSNVYTISTTVVLQDGLIESINLSSSINTLASTTVVLQDDMIEKRPAFLTDGDAQAIYCNVTGQVTFPANSIAIGIDTIRALWNRHGDDTEEYLRQFWQEWLKRDYSRANTAWLTEWAVGGELPKNGKKPKKEEVFVEEW